MVPKYQKQSWDVLLIGGASGTGKSSIAYSLARHFGVGITEVDDLHIVLETLTTPEQQPELHYWRTKPDDVEMTIEDIVNLHISVAKVMQPAIKAVIANHIETKMPIVLEGDYLLPELLADEKVEFDDRVKAVFLYEDDEQQLASNFLSREPEEGEQSGRAMVSKQIGDWLKRECAKYSVPIVASQPWDTVINRVLTAVD